MLAVQANTALGRGLRSIVEENSGFRLTKEVRKGQGFGVTEAWSVNEALTCW